jgi:hypothetical protein
MVKVFHKIISYTKRIEKTHSEALFVVSIVSLMKLASSVLLLILLGNAMVGASAKKQSRAPALLTQEKISLAIALSHKLALEKSSIPVSPGVSGQVHTTAFFAYLTQDTPLSVSVTSYNTLFGPSQTDEIPISLGPYYENKPIKLQVDGGTLLVTTPESPNQKKRRLVTEELFPSIFLSMGQAFNYDIPVKNNLISLHSVAFLSYGDTSTKFLQNFAKTLETALAKHRIVFISDHHDSSTCALGTALLLLNAGLPDESRKTNPVHYFFEFQFFNITYH